VSPRWIALLVGLAALLVHAPAASGEFVFHDDFRYVVNNEAIEEVGNPLRFFTDPGTLATQSPTRDIYRPVRTLSYAIITAAKGKEGAAPFHVLAILLHALTAALLAALLLRAGIGRFASAAGALFFALHPATVEVTAWVCSLGDAWCGLFSVASVLAYASGHGVLAALALVLALFSKEHAVVVPGLWMAWDICVAGRRGASLRGALLKAAAPGLAIVIGFLVFRGAVADARMAQAEEPLGGSHGNAILTMTAGLGWYAATVLFPYGPTFDAVVAIRETPLSLGVLLGLGALAALVWGVVRGSPGVRLGAAWFLLGLVPVSNVLVPLKIPTADRFLYLSLMGLSFCVAELARRTYPFSAKWMTPALAVLGVLAVVRIGDWRNSEALLEAGQRVSPKSHRLIWEEAAVSAEKAVGYLARGDLATGERLAAEALDDYDRYIRNSFPAEQTQVYFEIGCLLDSLGDARARLGLPERREAKSRALKAFVAARRLHRDSIGRATPDQILFTAQRIVTLAAELAEPQNPNLPDTIAVGLEAASFLKERHGIDDTGARVVFRLADSVRIRGQEPAKAREGLDWVLDALGRLESEGRRHPFLRAQALFYRAALTDREHEPARFEEAFRVYMEAAQQERPVRLRALTYAGRCACTMGRLFGDADWARRGREILSSIPAIARKDGLRLDAELKNEILTIESACGG
jgi:hypothetical protein